MKAEGLVKGRGVQRTDSLSIIGAVRELNRLEFVIETMRLALEEIASTAQDWFKQNIPSSWIDRYGEWAQAERIVKETGAKAKAEAERIMIEVGEDGYQLIAAIEKEETPKEIGLLEKVQLMKQVWKQQYRRTEKTIVECVIQPGGTDGTDGTDGRRKTLLNQIRKRRRRRRRKKRKSQVSSYQQKRVGMQME
jgi:transposase